MSAGAEKGGRKFKAWQRSEGWRRGGRCERELFYESQGLDPRNCITDDRELCPVCLKIVMRESKVKP
jgi:hypothetical protein